MPPVHGVQAGARQSSGDLDGIWDRHVDEVRAAVEGLVADSGQSLGQDDAPQRRGILEAPAPTAVVPAATVASLAELAGA